VPPEELLERLARVDGIMFDIDGCLVLSNGPSGQDGARVLAGATEAIELARRTSRKVCVFTNGTAQKPGDIAAHLRGMGVDVRDEEVLTPAVVAAQVMRDLYGDAPLMVFGGEGVLHDFRMLDLNLVDIDALIAGDPTATADTPIAAVVIGWDRDFGGAKLQVAAEAVAAGAKIYCTSAAPMFASNDRLNVGVSGFISAGLSYVTGQPYEVLGKPSGYAMDFIAAKLGVEASRVLVIGDDLVLEASMARAAGAVAGLVLTGTSTARHLAEAEPANRPDFALESMTELVELFGTADSRYRTRQA
jgi:HAD superfamily hydrolase (TIGR01450 family)